MSEVLAGGAVAIFAFVLAYLRDERKSAVETRRKDESVLSALTVEIATNLVVVQNLGELVRSDVRNLKERGGMVMNPLDPVGAGYWNVVALHLPRVLVRNPSLLSDLRDVTRRSE